MLTLCLIVLLALLIVRLGANALVLTGLSSSVAHFQASSAFFGVGFTTSEAELVVGHPVRRRIISHLIVAGNIGLTSVLATVLVTLLDQKPHGGHGAIVWLGLGAVVIAALCVVLNLNVVKRPLDRLMKFSLLRAGLSRVTNYEQLLNLGNGFVLEDHPVTEGHPWIDKELRKLRPADYGIIVLAVHRKDGSFVGAPDKFTSFEVDDVVLIYGREETLREVFSRSIGKNE